MNKGQKDIEILFHDKFEGFDYKPSEEVWNKLQKQLWWDRFLKFEWNRLNVWYAALILTGSLSTVIALNPGANNDVVQDNPSIADSSIDNTHTAIEHAGQQPGAVVHLAEEKKLEALPMPKASFVITQIQGCVPLEVKVVNQSDHFEFLQWEVNNTFKSSQSGFTHVFEKEGEYTISLLVKNKSGNDKITKKINVYGMPTSGFEIDENITSLQSRTLSLKNTSSNALQYKWYVDKQLVTSDKDFNHTFKHTGNKLVSLVSYNNSGCKDSISKEITALYEECYLDFPKAFVPGHVSIHFNKEISRNFKPRHAGIDSYSILIKDKVGRTVYQTENLKEPWSGLEQNGLPAPAGIYSYFAKGQYSNGAHFELNGQVSLLLPNQNTFGEY